MDEKQNVTLAGNWQGKYMDVRGYVGKVEMNLEHEGYKVSGSFTLTLADEDQPVVISGRLAGFMKEGSPILNVTVQPFQKKEEAKPVELELIVSDAGSYAEKAMYASFSKNIHPDLKGGVWIAWKFRKGMM